MPQRPRPKHLALHRITLPLPGVVSILHRISGALLFLALPLLLWLFQQSLRSPESWAQLSAWAAQPWTRLVLLMLGWAGIHHLLAGLRYLLIDLHWVSGLAGARASARGVLLASVLLTGLLGWRLW